MKAYEALLACILIVLVALLIVVVDPVIVGTIQGYFSGVSGTTSTVPAGGTSVPTTTIQQGATYAQLVNYTLMLINNDRANYSLPPVTLSYEPSGQQHADSMLQNDYTSHWDIYGMKPYMRYTLLGGRGAVTENIAFEASATCIASLCKGSIDPAEALRSMEYEFMYNDSQCCANGHRDNILNPYHNQVSIGIAYDGSRIYLVQDFIDNYTTWTGGTPAYSNGEVYLQGSTSEYPISSVLVGYDPLVRNMTQQQLNATFSYGYGAEIAGVVGSPLSYYQGLDTIVADRYSVNGNRFDIEFNMKSLIQKYGAGEYTVMVWLNATNSSFIGSTYTIFINQSLSQYAPSEI